MCLSSSIPDSLLLLGVIEWRMSTVLKGIHPSTPHTPLSTASDSSFLMHDISLLANSRRSIAVLFGFPRAVLIHPPPYSPLPSYEFRDADNAGAHLPSRHFAPYGFLSSNTNCMLLFGRPAVAVDIAAGAGAAAGAIPAASARGRATTKMMNAIGIIERSDAQIPIVAVGGRTKWLGSLFSTSLDASY